MPTKFLSCLFAMTTVCLLFETPSFGQNSYLFGVNTSIEKSPRYNSNFTAGILMEKQFCQKNSLELSVNYRHFQHDFSNEKTDFVLLKSFSISENYLTTSLLSKYNFKHFNIAFGPSADFLISWKNKSEFAYPYSDYLDKKIFFGLMAKVSKTIVVNKRVSLEPEIHFNPIFSSFSLYSRYVQLSDRQYLGLGITTKYKL